MEYALREMPLAFLTTLGPIGAGSFVTLFYMLLRQHPTPEQLKRIDHLTGIPIGFALMGFLVSLFQLANPTNIFYLLLTVGQTPIANAAVAYGVFLLVALLYWALAIGGRLTSAIGRLLFVGLVMVTGLLATIFMGLANMIPALPVWDAPRTVVEIVSVWLFGGSTLGIFLRSIARRSKQDDLATRAYQAAVASESATPEQADELTARIMVGIGALLLIFSSVAIFMIGSSTVSSVFDVDAISQSLTVANAIGQICVIITGILVFVARGRMTPYIFGAALVFAIAGVFLLRFCFYGFQIGIGL